MTAWSGIPLERGVVIAGRYEISEDLGRHVMGRAFRAVDRSGNVDVHLTAIGPPLSADAASIARLKERVTQLAAAKSASLLRPLAATPFRNCFFIVSQYERLPLLADLLAPGQPLPLHDALTITLRLAAALEEANRAGVVHGSLMPEFVHLAEDAVRLSGHAVVWPRTPTEGTEALFLRRAEYSAPECQVGSEGAWSETGPDIRSDLYSLGVVLYRMLVGRVPFTGNTPAEVWRARQRGALPPLPRGLLGGLYLLVPRCLAPQPQQRFQAPGHLVRELQQLLNAPVVRATAGASLLATRTAVLARAGAATAAAAPVHPAADPAAADSLSSQHPALSTGAPVDPTAVPAAARSGTGSPSGGRVPAGAARDGAGRAGTGITPPGAVAGLPGGDGEARREPRRTDALPVRPPPLAAPVTAAASATPPSRPDRHVAADPHPVGRIGGPDARPPEVAHDTGDVRRGVVSLSSARQSRLARERARAPAGGTDRPAVAATGAGGPLGRLRMALGGGKSGPGDGPGSVDPYETLRVDRGADLQLVTAAYRDSLTRALAEDDAGTAASLERAYARIRAALPNARDHEARSAVR